MTTSAGPLLEVEDLAVAFPGRRGVVQAVEGVSFTVDAGERVGIVGESGAGKSVTALSLLRLLPTRSAQLTGHIRFHGQDLLTLNDRQMRHIRGLGIAMIFQDPATCLSPRMTAGEQIVEAVRAHHDVSRRDAQEQAIDLLDRVGIPQPRRWVDEYPHKLSGGMAQRVMIAIAISCAPDLIIADEPTTALDVSIEAQIVDLLLALCEERHTAVVLITHDLALEARFAQRLLVMYGGRVVERGDVDVIYRRASHPYTQGLLASITRPDRPPSGRMAVIPGSPPSGMERPEGCAFHPRCSHAEDRCRRERPKLAVRLPDDHPCACHFAGQLGTTVARPSGRGPRERDS